MKDSQIILSHQERRSSGVIKMTDQINAELKQENNALKKSLLELQNGFEKLRNKFNKSEKTAMLSGQENVFLKTKIQELEGKIKSGKILDIILLVLSVLIAVLVNLVTNDLGNASYWAILVLFIIINAGVIYHKSR